MLVYLNGEYLPKEEARISVEDRGFLFGDGVYEVTRAVRGSLFQEEAHWQRLERGLRELELPLPQGLDRARVREISERLLRENGLDDAGATVYLQITRGAAPRTHWFPPADTAPTVYLSTSRFEVPARLRRVGVRALTHPDVRWARCDIKTVNLLPNVVAKQRAHENGCWEALLIRDGAVMEGSSSNAFGVIDGELRTYPNSNYILPGITRDVVIGLAGELGIPVRETPIFEHELPRLEELFFTGTTTDIQPVVELDGRPVGSGERGRVAAALQEALYRTMGMEVDGITA